MSEPATIVKAISELLKAVGYTRTVLLTLFLFSSCSLLLLCCQWSSPHMMLLASIIEKYFVPIVIVCSLSGIFTLVLGVSAMFKFLLLKHQTHEVVKTGKKRLTALTGDEKAILRLHMVGRTRRYAEGGEIATASGLASAGVLLECGQLGSNFAIHDWAYNYLVEHKGLIEEKGKS